MTRQGRPNITDIALRAGVSPTTVSHVLNRVPGARVADATRERVEIAARELGYQPNGLARALRTHRSNTLALLSDEIATTPYAGKLILGAQEAASRHGWLLIVMTTGKLKIVEEREISAIWRHQVDGVLYAAGHHRVLDVPTSLDGKPLIVVNAESTQRAHRSVYPDEYQGGYAATEELIRAGHTSIAFINTMTSIPAREGRLEGYRAALRDAGIRFNRSLVVAGRSTFAMDGYEAASALFRSRRPTAVFCFNDRMAMGTYRAAREAGLAIPKDLSVVGFDNQEIVAEALSPALTTLALPYYEMGAVAVDILVAELKGEPLRTEKHMAIASTLVRRESIRRLGVSP
ncbi:MAG: LacI family DNA-binding transcriptional regulator [Microbacteriaceae bacterium]|nr:LacI family DNA-binding transcriptional regulator [Microbacteriaceae bacterium]